MTTQKTKLYLLQYTDHRAPLKYASPYAEHEMDHMISSVVLLDEVELDINYPELDTRQMQIDALESAVRTERAESQSRVNILLERISKLKCLTHDADGVPV